MRGSHHHLCAAGTVRAHRPMAPESPATNGTQDGDLRFWMYHAQRTLAFAMQPYAQNSSSALPHIHLRAIIIASKCGGRVPQRRAQGMYMRCPTRPLSGPQKPAGHFTADAATLYALPEANGAKWFVNPGCHFPDRM